MTSVEDIFKCRKKDDLSSVKKTNQLWFDFRFAHSSWQCVSPYFASWSQDRIKNPLFITNDYTTEEILLIGDSAKKVKTLVISIVTDMLKTIPAEDFQRCYQKWEQRLHRCVAAQGDNIDVWKNKNIGE